MKRVADRKRLDMLAYRGPLSTGEIASGIAACLGNARAHHRSGKLLHANDLRGGAFSAFLVSQQEAGKVGILKGMALLDDNDANRWSAHWKDFRRHGAKNLSAQQLMAATEYPPDGPSLVWSLLEFDRDRSETLEQARQLGLYVEFIKEDRDWWTPDDLTPEILVAVEARSEKLLAHLAVQQKVGLFSHRALEVYRSEFRGWSPDIELGKEYTDRDFDERAIGLRGPYKRFLQRLLDEDVIDLSEHGVLILGEPLDDFLDGD